MTSAERSYMKAAWMKTWQLGTILFIFFAMAIVVTFFVFDKTAMDAVRFYALLDGTFACILSLFLAMNSAGQMMSSIGSYFMTRPVSRRSIYWGNCSRGAASVLLLVTANSALACCAAWVQAMRSHGAQTLDGAQIGRLLGYEVAVVLLVYVTFFCAAMATRKGVGVALLLGMIAIVGNVPFAASAGMAAWARSVSVLVGVMVYVVAILITAERMFARREI